MNLFRRLLSTVIALSLILSMVMPASATSNQPKLQRIFGSTRYETAFTAADALQEQLGASLFDTAIIASGTGFPDALSASYLACQKQAPILLSNGNNTADLVSWVQSRLAPSGTVYILGGYISAIDLRDGKYAGCGNRSAVSRLLCGRGSNQRHLLVPGPWLVLHDSDGSRRKGA